MLTLAALGFVLLTPEAQAGRCDSLIREASSVSGTRLVSTFTHLAQCDSALATEHYHQAFMARAKDADTLVALSMAAIEADVWNPVWEQLSKITSYDARDEIAQRVGEACTSDPKIVTFLQGAYSGIRSTIDFRQWDDAYIACPSDELTTWMTLKVEAPPESVFDEKFDALLSVYVSRMGVRALPHLSTAAIAAAENGPYDSILLQMDTAVQPELGERMSSEDKQALEDSLVAVAQAVSPNKARAVADRLANAGSEAAAVELLPIVYRDRIQSGGSFLYGAVAVETGECKGEKTAVLHLASVHEPGKRWFVQSSVEDPIRAAKAKLSKCSSLDNNWVVIITPEPLTNSKELDKWSRGLEEQWMNKGFVTKVQNEKTIKLP
jgi:hypothetical protein